MKPADLKPFCELLDSVCAMLSRGQYTPTETSAAIFFNALRDHDLATVKAAFGAHMLDPQRGRFAPVPADILAQIEQAAANDGRPEADEAWAIAVKAADERDTVVWTREICQAWGACLSVWDLGDQVGARMAFKAAYTRLLAEARERREPISWEPSLGSDAARRDDAMRVGVDAGRLPAALLPAPASQAVGLLEMATRAGCPDHVRARLQEVRDAIASRAAEPGPGRDALARARTEAMKAQARQAVAAFEGQA